MKDSPEKLTIRPIVSTNDPAWPKWYEIYTYSFPPDERVTETYFLNVFEKMLSGEEVFEQVLVMEEQPASITSRDAQVVAIAFIEQVPSRGLCFLWYLATSTAVRNQGHGTGLYHWIIDQFKANKKLKQMLFEVDMPETADEPDLATRRINWYRRLGAQLVHGIKYRQYISPDIPPKEMFLMVHPLESLEPANVYATAKDYFGEYLEQRGPLALA